MISQNLAQELNFTFDDLEANREGRFTEPQRKRLRLLMLRDVVSYGLLALLPLGGLVALLTGSADHPVNGVMLALLLILFGLLIFYVIRQVYATRADLTGGVKVVTGQAALHVAGRGLHSLSVGQQNFQISKKVYSAFAEDKFYRVYYAPKLKAILSVELAEY
ncbi:MAG: hypothetical protein ABI700_06340 [Chloroflexota bacterium]